MSHSLGSWNTPIDVVTLVSFHSSGKLHWVETLPSRSINSAVTSEWNVAITHFLACISITEAFILPQHPPETSVDCKPSEHVGTDRQPVTITCIDGTVVTAIRDDPSMLSNWIALILPPSSFSHEHTPASVHSFLPFLKTAAKHLMTSPICQFPLRCLFITLSANLVGDLGREAHAHAPNLIYDTLSTLVFHMKQPPDLIHRQHKPSLIFKSSIFHNCVTSLITAVRSISSTLPCRFCIFTPHLNVAFTHNLTSDNLTSFHWYFAHVLYRGDRKHRQDFAQQTPCGLTFLWCRYQQWTIFVQAVAADTPPSQSLVWKHARNVLLVATGRFPSTSG